MATRSSRYMDTEPWLPSWEGAAYAANTAHHRMFDDVFLAATPIGLGDRVLDLGCGSGDFTATLAALVGDGGKVARGRCPAVHDRRGPRPSRSQPDLRAGAGPAPRRRARRRPRRRVRPGRQPGDAALGTGGGPARRLPVGGPARAARRLGADRVRRRRQHPRSPGPARRRVAGLRRADLPLDVRRRRRPLSTGSSRPASTPSPTRAASYVASRNAEPSTGRRCWAGSAARRCSPTRQPCRPRTMSPSGPRSRLASPSCVGPTAPTTRPGSASTSWPAGRTATPEPGAPPTLDGPCPSSS